jgi:hypothetical protein
MAGDQEQVQLSAQPAVRVIRAIRHAVDMDDRGPVTVLKVLVALDTSFDDYS